MTLFCEISLPNFMGFDFVLFHHTVCVLFVLKLYDNKEMKVKKNASQFIII